MTTARVLILCTGNSCRCPVFPGDPERIRWSFPDPAEAAKSEEKQRRAFERTASDMASRLRFWLSLPRLRAAREEA